MTALALIVGLAVGWMTARWRRPGSHRPRALALTERPSDETSDEYSFTIRRLELIALSSPWMPSRKGLKS